VENQKGLVEIIAEKVWKFLASVKLAVVLLIILAIVSVIGTVIQQNQPTEQYLREYSEATVSLFEALGFFDLYNMWWFVLLLLLLTANLTVCTLDRFPHTWRIIKAPLKPIDDDSLKAVPFKKEIAQKDNADACSERVSKAIAAHGYHVVKTQEPDALHFAAQKGVYTRLGVYITHTSIIMIFVGALIGSLFGFKAFLNLPEGEASSVVYLRNAPMWDRIMASLGVSESPVIQSPQGGVPAMPIGYYVRCDSFDVDYYQGANGPTGMPSEFHSTLSVFNLDKQKILDKRIRVNDPLSYHGITFYQSSYGAIPDAKGKIMLRIEPKNRDERTIAESVTVDPGSEIYVKSIDRTIRALNFAPFGIRNPGTGEVMFQRTENDEFINPTVLLEVYKGKKPVYKTYVMKYEPGGSYMPEDYVIKYNGYWGARYTGLQVTKDPGVWVVYSGFILLCIGPLIAFFGSHKKIWVRIQDRKGQSVILVAGSVNRNRLGFEREFNKIVAEITK